MLRARCSVFSFDNLLMNSTLRFFACVCVSISNAEQPKALFKRCKKYYDLLFHVWIAHSSPSLHSSIAPKLILLPEVFEDFFSFLSSLCRCLSMSLAVSEYSFFSSIKFQKCKEISRFCLLISVNRTGTIEAESNWYFKQQKLQINRNNSNRHQNITKQTDVDFVIIFNLNRKFKIISGIQIEIGRLRGLV